MLTLLQDVRFAFRLFVKNPVMTAVAVLSLGLATGPNAALFSVVNTLFLRGTPAAKPEELVGIRVARNSRGESISYPDYRDLAEDHGSSRTVFVWERRPAHLSVRGWEELCPANAVSSNYFQGLGITPALGRLLSSEMDSAPGSEAPGVISHSLWQRRFGGDTDVLNQRVQMADRTLVIVGVAPPRFRGLDFQMPVDVWLPLSTVIRPERPREQGGRTLRDRDGTPAAGRDARTSARRARCSGPTSCRLLPCHERDPGVLGVCVCGRENEGRPGPEQLRGGARQPGSAGGLRERRRAAARGGGGAAEGDCRSALARGGTIPARPATPYRKRACWD